MIGDDNQNGGRNEDTEPQILVDDHGSGPEPVVAVDEAHRTVILTPKETIVVERGVQIDLPPKSRPPKVYGGMWGPVQIAAAALGMLALFAVVLLYMIWVAPSSREVEARRSERDRLEKELAETRAKYGDITSTETQVAKLVSSVSDFESNYLPFETTGRTALYQRINGLIQGYGLVNTSGPDYAPLELADQNLQNQSDEERGRARFRSMFPGIYVTTTVEGSYQNLRRFIRDIETGREFVVISAVQLEPSDTEEKQAQTATGAPAIDPATGMPISQPSAPVRRDQGKMHGGIVRLRLEMAAYFRRPGTVSGPAVPAV